MPTPKICKSAQLLPEISEAIDEVRRDLRMGLPEFMSTDPRVVKWFHDKGRDVPGITRAGRPRKPEAPPAPHVAIPGRERHWKEELTPVEEESTVEPERKPPVFIFGDENLNQS